MSRTRIYLDNAATSWPKPPAVYDAMDRYHRELGAPAARGGYSEAAEVDRLIGICRSRIARLIGSEDPQRIVFTANGTDSLNLALHGVLRAGDHVVTTTAEHNSILRPLRELELHHQVHVTRVRTAENGVIDPADLEIAISSQTKLIAVTHASNVTGALQPVAEIGQLARKHGVLLLVDAAQSLGHVPIEIEGIGIDLLAAPGHKGLLGPLGTGILYVRQGVERELRSLKQGGTGTQSSNDLQPESLPDKYECGNMNVPGILGLSEGVDFVANSGVESIRQHELALAGRLRDGLAAIPQVTLYGPSEPRDVVGVVSAIVDGYDSQELAAALDSAYRIQVRPGLHCAPLMHRCLGTSERGGTVRFSVGPFNTVEDVEAAIGAVREIIQEMSAV